MVNLSISNCPLHPLRFCGTSLQIYKQSLYIATVLLLRRFSLPTNIIHVGRSEVSGVVYLSAKWLTCHNLGPVLKLGRYLYKNRPTNDPSCTQ